MTSRYVLGIDIGGTSFTVGAVLEDGSRVAALRNAPTIAESGADIVLDRIIAISRAVMEETRAAEPGATFIGVGAGAPGPLDTKRGVVLLTPNLGWVDYPLADRLHEGLALPVVIDNDANCAVLGEWWMGAARGTQHAIGFTIGTGIGGGIIMNGRLYHGASDCAGEIGHTTIDSNGRRCACGNYGCLEAYASGPAIAERAREALQVGEASLLLEVVVIAGGVTRAGEALFEPLRAEVRRRAFKPAVDACRIVPGELPGTAGVVGAIAMYQMTT